jgi:hypothetical protein
VATAGAASSGDATVHDEATVTQRLRQRTRIVIVFDD